MIGILIKLSQQSSTHSSSSEVSEESEDEEEDGLKSEHIDIDIPPELLLQAAFTGRSAIIHLEEPQIQPVITMKAKNLQTLNYDHWINKGTVDFQDIPLWFEYQVCLRWI
jgi:hypothetical protein